MIALIQNPTQYLYGVLILAGLAFGMLGDIYLDQKWVYPDDSDKYLWAGFVSFGIGHLFYIPAIIITADIPGKLLWIPAAFAVVVCIFVLVTEKPTKQDYGKFRWIIVVYGLVVAGMAGTSMLAAIYTKSPAFMVDRILSRRFCATKLLSARPDSAWFATDVPGPKNAGIIMPQFAHGSSRWSHTVESPAR